MIRRLFVAGMLGLTGLLLLPAPAQAHPLGNFTTNQYAGLRVGVDGITVDYVLDLAELPAYQAQREEIDTDADGRQSEAERSAYATRTCASIGSQTTITVGGRQRTVEARSTGLTLPPGAGGLVTLRLECLLHADARITGPTDVTYRGAAFAERIGWREVTAIGDRITLATSSVPTGTTSGRLTGYPAGAATSDVRTASLGVRPGGPAATIAELGRTTEPQARGVDRLTQWFTDLVGHPQLTVGVGLLAFGVALVLGGAHAVAPGHGKTIMAAYLVGSRGRISQALTVAVTVAATHTVGVLALGVLLATSLQLAPQDLYDWLRLASGVLVALVGAHLLYRAIKIMRVRSAAASHPHDHSHDHDYRHDHDHDHDHDHSHDHDHDRSPEPALVGAVHHDHHDHPHPHPHPEPEMHSHGGGRPHTHTLPAPDEPLRIRTLLAMGFAGGLSPSPSAVVVLLGAAALGRAWYGVLLVLAYGIGLAATLIGIGYALAHWGERLRGRSTGRLGRLVLHRMPAATASVILAVGVGMVALAAMSLLGT